MQKDTDKTWAISIELNLAAEEVVFEAKEKLFPVDLSPLEVVPNDLQDPKTPGLQAKVVPKNTTGV